MSEIFHPDANAHRTHCQYIMKLHKTISAENIEDPILERFKKQADEEEKSPKREKSEGIELFKTI